MRRASPPAGPRPSGRSAGAAPDGVAGRARARSAGPRCATWPAPRRARRATAATVSGAVQPGSPPVRAGPCLGSRGVASRTQTCIRAVVHIRLAVDATYDSVLGSRTVQVPLDTREAGAVADVSRFPARWPTCGTGSCEGPAGRRPRPVLPPRGRARAGRGSRDAAAKAVCATCPVHRPVPRARPGGPRARTASGAG